MAFQGSLAVVTGRVTPAVPLSDAKAFLRVDSTAEDSLILSLIEGATATVERLTRRSLIYQTFRFRFDCFPAGPIELPRSPVVSVAASGSYTYAMPRIRYYSSAGTQTTLTVDTDYLLDLENNPPSLHTLPFGIWPNSQPGRPKAVEVDFVAGYGSDHTAVPDMLRQAILIMVANGYDNRENTEIPEAVNRIARLYHSGGC